ncbi:MAG: DMT family transporter [Actinomycetota bacterium]|nr:DMT family transporter [Actinomycetota bacterium]
MAAIALALAASVTWGSADFVGGLLSRRLALASVVAVSQAAGLAAVLAAAAVVGGVEPEAVGLGALAGLFGGVGVVCYYRALAVGTMSIIAPLTACGALVPFTLALAGGERPSAGRLAGALVALAGAILASFHEHGRGGASRDSVLLALVTALMFGLLFYFLARASSAGGALSALLGSRAGSFSLLALGSLALRPAVTHPSAPALAGTATAGVLAAAANGLFGLAAERGLLSIVSLLAALYPVTTVLLAQAVLGERFTLLPALGVAVTLTGVAIVVSA